MYYFYKKNLSVTIEYQGKVFIGNTKIVLLEQLEQHNFKVFYACRVGICFCCKIKLLKGKVIPITENAIKKFPWILSCSSIPKSSLILE